MSEFYNKMADTANRLVTKFGQPVTLTKRYSDSGVYDDFGNVVEVKPDLYSSGQAVASSYTKEEIDGTSIIAGDIKLTFVGGMVNTDIIDWWTYFFAPFEQNDAGVGLYAEWNGKEYRIMSSEPVSPSSTIICYRLQLRS